MEVAKEALRHASANHERTAIISDQKSYSYAQIVASALDISNILSNKWIENVSIASFSVVYLYIWTNG